MNIEEIKTPRLTLKLLPASNKNSRMALKFNEDNKSYFAPYESKKAPIYYTTLFQDNILDTEYKASLNKRYLRYYVFLNNKPDEIIGTVSFGNVMELPFCQANIGYRFHKDFTSMGYCTEACTYAINTAFAYLKLHRINAYIMEDNLSSIKVAEKLGFTYEGTCIQNIKIQDKWENHRLYSLINPLD